MIACVELNQLRLDITRPSRKTAAWPILIRKKNSSFVSLQRGNKRRRAIFTHSRACSQHSTCAHGERKRAQFLLFSFSLSRKFDIERNTEAINAHWQLTPFIWSSSRDFLNYNWNKSSQGTLLASYFPGFLIIKSPAG